MSPKLAPQSPLSSKGNVVITTKCFELKSVGPRFGFRVGPWIDANPK